MSVFQSRRSCRIAMAVPIRIYGIDYRGVDFTEDAFTVIVNLHGAMIRTIHQLLPDAEIRLISQPTGKGSIFRVVSKLERPERRHTYWGVENLHPEENIWGADIPPLAPEDQLKTRVMFQCPRCSYRVFVHADERRLAELDEQGGMERTCPACEARAFWKLLPFHAPPDDDGGS